MSEGIGPTQEENLEGTGAFIPDLKSPVDQPTIQDELKDSGIKPTRKNAKIDKHPISSFNLNAHGENPDFESPDAPDLAPSQELQAELRDLQAVEDLNSGQSFGLLELNRGSSSRPLVNLLEYSVDAQHPDTNYMLEQVAIQSGRHMFVLENPSTGKSDKLTKEQKSEHNEGKFDSIAKGMLGVLKAQGVTEIDLEGASLAGRMAAAVAAHAADPEFQITVRNLILIEPAGFDEASFAAMIGRLIVVEGMTSMGKYRKHLQDPRGKASADIIPDVVKNYSKMIKKDAAGNLKDYPNAIRSGTLEQDVATALATQPTMKAHIISGGASAITKRRDVSAAYGNLSNMPDPNDPNKEFADRVHMIRLPGDTHMFNVGAARRVGWHVSRLLNEPKA